MSPTLRLLTAVLTLVPSAAGGELLFSPAQLLPGDDVLGSAAGMQVDPTLALGGNQFLAVWTDYRSSLDAYPPFLTEGSGGDVYAARLDAAGNPIDATPLMIDQFYGDQVEPRVGWNGQHWLVVWKQDTSTLPTYEMIVAARVAADGTVLDDPPIVVHDAQTFYQGTVVEGGNGEWVVLTQANADGLFAVRILGDGTVSNPGGTKLHTTSFGLDFDLAFAQDRYLIVWGGVFDPAVGQLFREDLTAMAPEFSLPFSQHVASDGDGFLVVADTGSAVQAVPVSHTGVKSPTLTVYSSGGCCSNVSFDGTYYWVSWGQTALARVTPTGVVVDPGGFLFQTPATWPIQTPSFAGAPGGGLQAIWYDGVSGAGYPKDVWCGRISPSGALASELLVSTGAPAQEDADFARGAGIHAVVFRSRTSDAARILLHRLDDSGAALDPEPLEVATGPLPGLGLPSIGGPAVAWNGSLFLVTWSDGLFVFARRMLDDGTFVDPAPLTVMPGFDPDVAAVGSTFLVVGIDFLLGIPQYQAAHSMRVDGPTGAMLDPAPNPIGGFHIFARYPHVVSFGDRWLAVWQRNLSHNSPTAGTTAAFVDVDGTTPGVFDLPLGWRPDVAVSADTALFVAVTNTVASATTDLEGQLMAADGTLVSGVFSISTAADKQLMPAATWNGTEFVVAWEDKRNAVMYFDERTDVYGARVAVDGTVLDPEGVPLSAAPEPEIQPALLSVGATTLLAASVLRNEPNLAAYRLGVQVDGELGTSYCTAGTSASGCKATISGSGVPSISAPSGFFLNAANVEGAKDGLFFFGTNGRQASPWGNGTSYQCVVPPVSRTGLLTGTGTPGTCDGAFAQDLNALWCPTCPKPQKNPGAGAVVRAQLWYRDPLNTSNRTTSLSDAMEFPVQP